MSDNVEDNVESDVESRFDETTAAQIDAFADDRILMKEITEKNVDFDMQLLILLHCFSDNADDASCASSEHDCRC